MNICIVSGSARPERKSHQVAQEVQRRLGAQNVENWLWDVKETSLPLLDHTFDSHPDPSKTLKRLKANLDKTDGFIIVSPEHNGNYSGVLKNSMDYFYKEYADKYFGMITVSTGKLGGVNALKGLQHYALRLNGIVCPQFLLTPQVQKLFTDQKLSDESYSERLDGFLAAFLSFSKFAK